MSGILINPYTSFGGGGGVTAFMQYDFNDGTFNNAGTGTITETTFNGAGITAGSAYEGANGLDCNANNRAVEFSGSFAFGTDNFTLECWRYNIFNSSFYDNRMFRFDGAGVGPIHVVEEKSTNHLEARSPGGDIITSVSLGAGAWDHICLERVGTTLTLYANGVSQGTTSVGTTDFSTQTRGLYGALDTPVPSFSHGRFYYDLIRVTLGDNQYGGPFTPPTSF